MKKAISALLITFSLISAFQLAAQEERLHPLLYNPAQVEEAEEWREYNATPEKRSSHGAGNQILFLVDSVNIPFVDDFSSNKVKRYRFDRNDTGLIIRVCPDFLVDDTIVNSLEFMYDTSYSYSYNSQNNQWDSTPLPPIEVAGIDTGDCQTVTYRDTVWPVPSGRVIGGVLVPDVDPDSVIFSANDTLFIVPAENREILWTSSSVYINNGMGVDAPTVGVATFDGLDSIGYPYIQTGPSDVYGEADVFPSAPIFLRTKPGGGTYNNSDSLYLSFYYQPQGLGNRPEQQDSLVLEFYDINTGEWNLKWSTEGTGVQPFEEVFIPINDSAYFQDGFKFRFKNFSTLTGNFDHWHIDYVRINSYTNSDPEIKDDVAYSEQAPSVLKEFSRMPWSHYQTDPEGYMAESSSVQSYNLSDVQKFITYALEIYDQDGAVIFNSSSPVISPNFPPREFEKEEVPLENFVFTSNDGREKKTFRVVNQLTSPDDIIENNRSVYNQEFPLHYAYDDRSAEHAYEVVGAGARIAAEYSILLEDTLKAVNIYFPPTLEDYSDNLFRIKVWSSLTPQEEIHSSIYFNPRYTQRNLVSRYEIDPPIPVSGTVYVGIEQQNRPVYVGFDANFNRKEKFYFNAGGGWNNMSFDGSLMIHPEFDAAYDPWPVSSPDLTEKEDEINVYPNPVSEVLFIQSRDEHVLVHIFDLAGRKIKTERVTDGQIDVSDLKTGTYIVQIQTSENTAVRKIIKQ